MYDIMLVDRYLPLHLHSTVFCTFVISFGKFGCTERKYNETSEKYRELQSKYFSKSEYWVSLLSIHC